MRNGAKPGTAKQSAGEWDGAAWDRLLARWAGDIGAVDFGDRGGIAMRPGASVAMSGFPAVIDLATLDGTNGFRIAGLETGDICGLSVSDAGDVNGDGIDDIILSAPDVDNRTGESYVVFGRTDGFPARFDLATLDGSNGFSIDGKRTGDFSGCSVSGAGDVNGDGFDDLIIGARDAEPQGRIRAGETYVVFGKAEGFTASLDLATLDGSNGFLLYGPRRSSSGDPVSSAGDVNGDGFDDIIIGSFDATASGGGGDGAGKSWVVFGKAEGFDASFDLADLDGSNGFRIPGVSPGDNSGNAISAAGDINGDGYDDIIIGSFWADPGGDDLAGESYVIFGKSGGFAASLDLTTLDGSNGFRLTGVDAGDWSGYSVSSAGDVNGDGFDDIIVGAPGGGLSGSFGKSYVVFGKADGFTASLDLATLDGINGFRLDGIDAGDRSGSAVSSAGDVNGDGFDDIIVGARDANDGAGETYVVFGKAGGFVPSVDLATLDGSDGFRLDGIRPGGGGYAGDFSGGSVSSAGDINHDGFDDIIIGAYLAWPDGDIFAGESYVIYGQAPDEAVRRVGSAADQTIRGGDFNDNLLGKGGDDTLAGGGGKDKLIGGSGADDFLFASTDPADADQIKDFMVGIDQIALDGDVFGLVEGALQAFRFVVGTAAADASDRLIYNSANGQLFFDADGTGAQTQVLIATLTGAPVIAASDIVVI